MLGNAAVYIERSIQQQGVVALEQLWRSIVNVPARHTAVGFQSNNETAGIDVNLTEEKLEELTRLLGARREQVATETVLYIGSGGTAPAIVLTIAMLQDATAVLSAQTVHGYFELHHVDRFVPVETGEVIFVAEEGSKISGLVVGREGTCSLFSNVDRTTLSADFSTLEPSLLLAAMQLGLAENITV